MNNLIEVANVSKSFGGVLANNDISITVPEGKITGLIGPNGSGKTTLFNSIVGYHPIDSGSIKFKGAEISKKKVQQIARLGMLRTFQQTRIYSLMNCVDNMLISVPHRNTAFFDMFRPYPNDLRDKAEVLLEFVGLYEKRKLRAGDLSFGQQKLLEFAMALMNEPEVWHHLVRDRTQYAGDHEPCRRDLLPRPWRITGPWRTVGSPERPARD